MLKLLGGWTGVHLFNFFIIVFFLVNGTGFGLVRGFLCIADCSDAAERFIPAQLPPSSYIGTSYRQH
jgi:hypothetical protein